MAEWLADEIRNATAPANKRTAAPRCLAVISNDHERDAREAAAFLCSYTHGRPNVTTTIRAEQEVRQTPTQLVAEFRQIMDVPDDMEVEEFIDAEVQALPHAEEQRIVDA